MNKLILHSVTFFLLIIFVSLKVVNTHYVVHYFDGDEKIVNCDICTDFQNNINNEFISSGTEEIDHISLIPRNPKNIQDHYVYQPQMVVTGSYYNKPPPTRA